MTSLQPKGGTGVPCLPPEIDQDRQIKQVIISSAKAVVLGKLLAQTNRL
jgi:hypothetical protein